jgi:TPR repeat protein
MSKENALASTNTGKMRQQISGLIIAWLTFSAMPALGNEAMVTVALNDNEITQNIAETIDSGKKAYDNRNYPEAFRIFRKIAVLGGPEIHFRLGLMYAEGIGTEKNPVKASYWLKSAAKQQHPGATTALAGLMRSESL